MAIRLTLHGSQTRGLSLDERAALARKHGYQGLDFSLADVDAAGGPDAIRDLLSRHGLSASTVGGVLGAQVTVPDEEWAPALAQVREKAQRAAAAGGTRTGTVLPCRTDEPKDTLWPRVVQRIRQVDEALDGTGVRLGMEFLGVKTLRLERPHPFVQSMAEANTLFAEAGARNVGHTLDSYHWYAGNDTLDTIRSTPAERIVLLHVNDAKDLPREQLMDQDRLLPGEGVIPLADWLRAIDSTGFDGFIALEVLGPRLAEVDAEERARLGKETIAPLLAALR
ncbi:MAG TPA: sugar phosphate isomerase/epimerase [Chloroflexota bacterium]|nr:sugar phosphate isomerase/epimerase [Chloroflexota bacterium]